MAAGGGRPSGGAAALRRRGAAVLLGAVVLLGMAATPTAAAFTVRRELYDGHAVLDCVLADVDSVQRFVDVAAAHDLDVWTKYAAPGRPVRVRVQSDAERALVTGAFRCTTAIPDLAAALEADAAAAAARRVERREAADFFDHYHPFKDIVAYLGNLADRYPALAKVVPSIGTTVEGRPIPAIHIRSRPDPAKTIFVSAGMHAREWVAHAAATYIAQQLLERYGADNATTALLDRYEVVVVPVANPDGYQYTWTDDRLWRKNRRKPADGSTSRCAGTDLNRNFANHWGGVGASKSPCAQDYRGPDVASEPETQAIQQYVLGLRNRAIGIDLHAYGQLILRSYGYTADPSPREDLLREVSHGMQEAMRTVHGAVYTSMRAAELYPTTGSTDDWYTEQAGMIGWTVELRDEGKYGFRLPDTQIRPTVEEMYAGFVYLANRLWPVAPASN